MYIWIDSGRKILPHKQFDCQDSSAQPEQGIEKVRKEADAFELDQRDGERQY